ncbi:response regulator [bacterium]|nr:response regulator [bacterium]
MDTLRALIVEDSAEDYDLMIRALEAGGFQVTATRVETPEDFTKALAEPRDVVFCDYMVPGFPTAQAFAEFRERQPDIPFIVVSGRVGEEAVVELMREGVSDFVSKNNLSRLPSSLRREFANRATRRSLEAQLRGAQRMEAVGRFAGGIAHEFNNILTVIGNFTAFARESLGIGHPVTTDLDQVLVAVDRGENLARRLLAFASRQPGEPANVDINIIVTDLELILRKALADDTEMSFELEPYLPPVRIDPAHFEHVLVNLVVNARDAVPAGGRIAVRTRRASSRGGLSDFYGQPIPPDDYVVLEIADNGPGIDPNILAHIFEPFFTTKPEAIGTGLGLSTVYGIVSQVHGWIRVENASGGAVFQVYLPIARGAGAPALAEPAPPQPYTILVVEDDDQVRALTARVLRWSGYEVLEALDAEIALDMLKNWDKTVDLLLTDLVMPRQSGFHLAQRALELRPGLGVLYMTGYSTSGFTELDEAARRNIIQKPFTAAKLSARVRETLSRLKAAATG